MIKIDFSWIEDEADRAKLMAVWQAGDRDAYFKLHDAVWLKQLGIKELPSNSHQPNPNEEYYGDSRYQSKDSYLPG
jgi:hypothetical protein